MNIARTFLVAASALVLVASSSTPVFAQCDFNASSKAKGFKFDMTRAFADCPGVSITMPNTTSELGGFPACTPPTPLSTFNFGPKGKCSASAKVKLEAPCKTGSTAACSNVTIKAKCSDITEADGTTPITTGQWTLSATVKVTGNDGLNGDMTVQNIPALFLFDAPNDGKLSLKTDTNTHLSALLGGTLPGCTNLQLLDAIVRDPSGNAFATIGTSTR